MAGRRDNFSLNPSPAGTAVRVVDGVVDSVADDGVTVTVRTRDGRKIVVQGLSPAGSLGKTFDSTKGAGYTFGPERGSLALVLTSSYGESYLLGYTQPVALDSFQGNRQPVQPGDQRLSSRGGGFVEVLASALTRIGASELAQIVADPLEDTVKVLCQNFGISAGLGDISWVLDKDTKKGALELTSRSGTDEGSPAASLILGNSQSGSVAELRTSSGKESSVSLDRVGNARIDAAKDVSVSTSAGNVRLQGSKVFINSGSVRGIGSFKGNFARLPSVPVIPGAPPSLAKFPALKAMPTSLPIPDPKKILNSVAGKLPVPPLKPVKDALSAVQKVASKPLPKLS